MTETTAPHDHAHAEGFQIGLGTQYIKDFSFEIPNAPQIFTQNMQPPALQMGVNVQSQGLKNSAYEVVLSLKLEAKIDTKIAFIAELAYGGVFVLQNVPEEQMKMFLLVEAPRLLFPFARAIVTNAIREGGFPHVVINPVDFYSLYMANKDNVGSMVTAGAA